MRNCAGSELSQTEFSTAADAAMRSEAKNTSVVAVAAAASARRSFMGCPILQLLLGSSSGSGWCGQLRKGL